MLSDSRSSNERTISDNALVIANTISNPENSNDENFGSKTGIYNNFIIISSPGDNSNLSQNKSGKVYLFEYGANIVKFNQGISNPGLNIDEGFGASITIIENHIFISAPQAKLDNNYFGLIYVFKLLNNGTTVNTKNEKTQKGS